MAGEYIFNLQQLTKQVDRATILDNINLAFYFGAKIGVIGANGSGKSTLLRIMAGIDKDYMGTVTVAKNARVGYLPQEPRLDPEKTVEEVVNEGVAGARAILARYDEICDRLGEDLSDEESEKLNHELGRVQDQIDAHDLWELDHHVELAMDALRLPPSDMKTGLISGGEKRRVALCRLLLSNPDVLLLDEPTNHLDADSVAWIEAFLKSFKGTIVVVTHDRYFLNNVTEWILELDAGRGFPYKGNYESWLEQKQSIQDREAKAAANRQKLLARELEWIRMNSAARMAKNSARIKRYEELASQQVDTQESNLTIQIPSGERLGDLVVRADKLSKGYDERILMEEISFDLPRGGIVGVIGGNGAGKTTLFRMIIGQEQPDAGTLTVGPTVRLSYVDQSRDSLHPDHTVFEEISGGQESLDLGGRSMNSRAYCARFNFKGTDQQKKVGTLSGGERNRVHLAKLLRSGGNLLLLDEPTNDLDVETLRSLEEGLLNFGGCAVVISHDRWFLDRIATHILAFEGDSNVEWFEGNYEAYQEQRRKRLGEAATRPHRMTFRPVRHR
ncbi:MAG TPA: energy-dependent translational throttle protein EttA [Kiritimatiellia bacterium]|nr:energy-dependent translational throttle protein EttA [Kiritimatiellia bacterium]